MKRLLIVLFMILTCSFAFAENFTNNEQTVYPTYSNKDVPKIAKIYYAMKNSYEFDYGDNIGYGEFIILNDELEPSKREYIWDEWCARELDRTRFVDNSIIYGISKSLMQRNNTFGSIIRILDIKRVQKTSEDNPILTDDELYYRTNLHGRHSGVIFQRKNIHLKEADLIIAKNLKYTHARLVTWGWDLERYWKSEYRNFKQNCVSLLGSYVGAMLDIINLLSLLIILLVVKKCKGYTFRKKFTISFFTGFIAKLLVLPLPIIASKLECSYFPSSNIFIELFAGGLFGIIAFFTCILLNKTFYTIMTPKETRIKEKEKEVAELIEKLILNLENSNDYEMADFIYKLMIFRDSSFKSQQIHAFLDPEKNKDRIKSSILRKLAVYKFFSEIIIPNNKLAFIWFHTLNAYISNKNKELMQKVWKQLKRGFELAKPRYIQSSSKFFNFDNTELYQIPIGME